MQPLRYTYFSSISSISHLSTFPPRDASQSQHNGGSMQPDKPWVDFKQVKAAVSMEMVLAHYGVNWLRKSGAELRGKCPIHQGDSERAFHVNLNKGAFNCFSCKAHGNVLDLVAAIEQCTVRDAAIKLAKWFQVDSTAEVGEPIKKTPRQPSSVQTPAQSKVEKSDKPELTNPPLKFELRVNTSHDYGLRRGLTQATLDLFGAGLCLSKGMFAGRFVIPLHDEQGRLVGYAGRSLNDSEPKYLFPSRDKGFYKSDLLFNLHRVLETVSPDTPLIIVEGFFDCMKTAQAGFNVVSLLGSSLSEAQEELLVQNFNQLVLLFDGDAAGRKATEDCLKRLAWRVFVHAIELAEEQQPDQLSTEELRLLVGLDE
jgi:DNA primase